MSCRLTQLIVDTKRRFVEAFGNSDLSSRNLASQSGTSPTTEVKTSFGPIRVPYVWLEQLVERRLTFNDLGLDRETQDKCLCDDYEDSIATAARVVLTLWSALESHWGFGSSKQNWSQLIYSCLWYAPMCGEEQQFIPFLKYQLSYIFALAEHQRELPEKSELVDKLGHLDGLVLLGWLGRFFKSRAFGDRLIHKEWRNTILHGVKKGLPQMGLYHLKKACFAMKSRLTKVEETSEESLDEVSRTSREIYGQGILYEDWMKVDPFINISDAACYERTRSNRGVLGLLYDMDEGCETHRMISPDQFGGMYWDPSNGVTKEIRLPSWLPDEIYRQQQRKGIFSEERGSAAVKPILEPLKIRMISAGSAASNGYYSRLQKCLWKRLQRFSQFRLTGKSVSTEDIDELRKKTALLEQELNVPLPFWVSGDYSAATDNLHGDATDAAIRSISADPITLKVLRQGLCDTLIDFSKMPVEGVPEPFLMTNGQLMGCVFSFPILCVINIAMYRAALEERFGRKFRVRDLPVYCNGDDILFKCDAELLSIWERKIRDAGFEKSVGKNYVSMETAIINSTYFDMSKEKVKKVPYLNMGWCTGVKKGGQGYDGEDESFEDIIKIRDQLETSYDQLLADPEFVPETFSQKEFSRRKSMFDRFRDEIRIWNWPRIVQTGAPAGCGPIGLGLKDNMSNEDWIESLILFQQRPKSSFGCSAVPKSMAPWKIVQRTTEVDWFEELRDARKEYMRMKKQLGSKQIVFNQLVCQYLDSLKQTAFRKFEETRYVVGAL